MGTFVKAKSSGTNSEPRIKFEGDTEAVESLEITALANNALALPTSSVATNFNGKLVADSTGNKLVLSVADPLITGFTVAAGAGAAALGLTAGPSAANNFDFEIQVSKGPTAAYKVTLTDADADGVLDIDDVVEAIELGDRRVVQVEINEAKTGLTLIDKTFVSSGPMRAHSWSAQSTALAPPPALAFSAPTRRNKISVMARSMVVNSSASS